MVSRYSFSRMGTAWMTTLIRMTSVVLILMTATALVHGLPLFEQPISASAKTAYNAELKRMSVKQLETALAAEISLERSRLIVAELSLRGPGATAVLKEYRRTQETNDPATRMVLADVEIALARIERTGADYVKSLENMLSTGDSYAVDAAAPELGQIGSAEALAALRSHEKQGRPSIKIARLQLEYGKLPVERRVAAILESARLTIRERKGNDARALVAEGSILMWLWENAEPLIKKELEAVSSQPPDALEQQYRAFLEETLQDLQRARVMRRTATTLPIATMPISTSALPVPPSAEPLTAPASRPAGSPSEQAAEMVPRGMHQNSKSLISRSEERGDDFSGKSVDDLIKVLLQSKDRIEHRKAAMVLGNRGISATLGDLNDAQKTQLKQYVEALLADAKSSDASTRTEANEQLQRLWRIAAPTLIEHVDDQNMTVAEASAKNLILMRDEQIVQAILQKAKAAQEREKVLCVFCLGKMTERRASLVPGRQCMSSDESKAIASRLIRPYLEELSASTSPQLKTFAQRGLISLDQQTPAGIWVKEKTPANASDGK